MPIFIRPVTKEDEAALSKICLETSEAGKSGRDVHNYPSLPGEVYALPYVNVPGCVWGFVLVEKPTETSPPSDEFVVGYTLGALDSRAFEAAAAQTWWPPLKAKYAEVSLVTPQPTETDQRYIKSIMNFPPASDAEIAFSPAHLHIDILESHQRRGWGKKLIGMAIKHLKEKGLKAVWLGVDPRNKAAALFYERLGFHTFDGAPEAVLGSQLRSGRVNGRTACSDDHSGNIRYQFRFKRSCGRSSTSNFHDTETALMAFQRE